MLFLVPVPRAMDVPVPCATDVPVSSATCHRCHLAHDICLIDVCCLQETCLQGDQLGPRKLRVRLIAAHIQTLESSGTEAERSGAGEVG